jgi:hypothetical protein
MNKAQAIDLLNQIAAKYQSLKIGGFYTKQIRTVGTDAVELRLITSLDPNSRKKLASLVSSLGLKMDEDNGLVIIYEPWAT